MRVAFIIPDKEMPWDSVHQGIGYVAAYAKKHFTLDECQVFRTYDKEEKDLLDFLEQKWDVIGFTLTNSTIGKEVAGISEMIKSIGPTKVVVGGAEPTTMETKILEQFPNVDYAVSGEGEITFYELLQCLANGGGFSNVRGLIYREGEGNICKNPPRGFEKNLEIFPYPDRTLFQYPYDYHSIIGTRGCPFQCTFCNSSDNWGRLYRRRNPKVIAEEVKYILELYGREKYLIFNDDLFNIKKDWVLDVCRELKELRVSWWIRGLRADFITEEIADSLVESGCFGAACGIESANNNALKSMRKVTTIEKTMKGVELMQSKGMSVVGQFIIGNQGDTLETVKESIEYAQRFSESTFGIAYPISHTFLYDYVKNNNCFLPEPVPVKHKGETIDWILFDTPHFPVEDRLKAVELAIAAKVYRNVQY
jgi:radical SAM superfamily enzyme YgiQ (UPF0313 family)